MAFVSLPGHHQHRPHVLCGSPSPGGAERSHRRLRNRTENLAGQGQPGRRLRCFSPQQADPGAVCRRGQHRVRGKSSGAGTPPAWAEACLLVRRHKHQQLTGFKLHSFSSKNHFLDMLSADMDAVWGQPFVPHHARNGL